MGSSRRRRRRTRTEKIDVSRWSRCPDCGEMIDEHPLIHQINEHGPRIGDRASGRVNWRTDPLLPARVPAIERE